MNKIYLCSLLTFLTTTTFAQIKFAPEIGLNMAMQKEQKEISALQSTEMVSSKLSPGVSAGLNLDIKVLRNLYINTGAFYMFHNIKYDHVVDFSAYGLDNATYIRYDRVHDIRVPLYVMYKSGYEGMGRFTAGIGAYMAYAVGGNRLETTPNSTLDTFTEKMTVRITKSNKKMKFGDDPILDQRRCWDYGLNACIGYESNIGLYFRGTVNYGLVNLDPAASDQFKVRNWGLGFSIGYLIGKDNW